MKKIKLVLLTLNGKNFKCKCGANIFIKHNKNIYICNACGNIYEGV